MTSESHDNLGPEFVGGKGRPPHVPSLPPTLARMVTLVGVLLIAGLAIFFSCVTYVAPYEFGIKEVKVGVTRGIHKTVYPPGWWFVTPFGMEKMHKFPRHVLTLELTDFANKESKAGTARHSERAAKIQTSDGFYVDVDVTILYKIVDPYKVITSVGPGTLFLTNGILPKAEPILKEAFGELTTEDFYNSEKRVDKGERARQMLDTELEPKGLKIDQVLVRYFKYSDEIQKNIEEKKLQDQLVFKNQAEAQAAKENAELQRTTQEGEMLVQVALQEGEAYKVEKEAARDLYTRKKRAEADLLVQLAEAKRTELRNKAMQAQGSDLMVAQKMAEVLEGLDTIIIPTGGQGGLNPLDLEKVLALFGANRPPGAAVITPLAPTPTPEQPVGGVGQ